MAPVASGDHLKQSDEPDELAQKEPQVAQDHAYVVTAAVQHREEGVAGRSLERASGQTAVGSYVPDHRLEKFSIHTLRYSFVRNPSAREWR